jgi:hypothetical protein
MNGRAGGDVPPFDKLRANGIWGYGLLSFAMIFLFTDKF